MADIAVGMWRVDSATLVNQTVAQRLDALRVRLRRALDGVNADRRIFMVPEFYFMHAARNADVLRWYTRAEKDAARRGIAEMSGLYPNLVLVGGTVCWAKKKRKLFQRAVWHVANHAMVATGGRMVAFTPKSSYGGEYGPEDYLRLYKARRGDIDLSVWDRDWEREGVHYKKVQVPDLQSIVGMHHDKTRDGRAKAPGAAKAHARYGDRVAQSTPRRDPTFTLPNTDLTGGVEICQEHNSAALRAANTRGPVHLHLLVSNSVTTQPGNAHIREGGLFIHCDPHQAACVMRKQNGAVAHVDEDWVDLGDKVTRIVTTI